MRNEKKLKKRAISDQRVCVEENTLGVVDELPAVQLGEGDSELWTFQKFQIFGVFAVKNLHVDDLVESGGKLGPRKQKRFWLFTYYKS